MVMALDTFLFFTGNPSIYLIARAVIGISEALAFVGFVGIIIRRYPRPGEATPALGKLFSIMGIGLVLAPSIGSLFLSYSLQEFLFGISIGLLLIASIFIYKYGKKIISRSLGKDISKSSISSLLYFVPFLMVFSVGSSDGSYQSRAVIWFTQSYLDPKNAGYAMTMYYIAAILSQLVLPVIAKKKGFKKAFIINILVATIGLIIMTALTSIPASILREILMYLIAFFLGFDVGLLSPYGTELVTRIFGKNYLIGSGTANTIWAAGYFLMPLILAYASNIYYLEMTILFSLHILNFILALKFLRI